MSARGQLQALVDAGGLTGPAPGSSPSFFHEQMRRLDIVHPLTARHAAVLMLFGPLDDRPAEFHGSAVPQDLDVLLVERAGTLTDHPGQIAFPGGRIDAADGGAVAAALREAREETGLDTAGVEVLGVLPEVALPVSNFLVTPVLAWWASPSPVGVVDFGESAQVFRTPVADLLDPGNRRTAVTSGRHASRTPAFLVNGVTVWGFTGMLLDGLFEELGWTVPWDTGRESPAPL
jgi:8-oxo-dGTP pyrophosphatase MutT (NUDIX family)